MEDNTQQSKARLEEFQEAVKPVQEYLRKYHDLASEIIIDGYSEKLVVPYMYVNTSKDGIE